MKMVERREWQCW